MSGVYIFSRFDHWRQVWEVLYVGETGSFRDRIPPHASHEKWGGALLMGATNVIAMTAQAGLRVAVEKALIAEFDPPLNVEHRRLAAAAEALRLFFPIPGYSLVR